ncbi:MAG: hypothetical protein CMN97_00360 [Synechococcus sp. NAT40]|jgi:hypothetical protein|uniref:DUF3119 family protein n=1 Tax=Synechococcus sp. MIT S9451 TaxID=3082543 RepID=UPI000C943864|nr:hypothetical protein [Synechococcus sp. NAT40]RZO14224.1 MAG: DUF3119 family protein [Synechococcus sp. MED-G135]|tara:strand:+ start:71 stop:493 length:423 start_codon:yes stop_codon:yes gene_type:complete
MPNPSPDQTSGVSIAPSPRLPLLILLLGPGLLPLPLHPWPTLINSLIGLALLVQSYSLRLEFQDSALIVWRGEQQLRHFPYEDWISWRVFWPGFPTVLYFRESKSPHLIPVIFNAEQLQEQLRTRVGNLEHNAPPSSDPS